MLAKIVSIVADERSNIRDIEARTFEMSNAQITMVVAVTDRNQLDKLIARIRRIKGVRAVQRMLR
jgi:(p)ppGpp synthase/HD superfamily hydrolase